MQDYIGAFEENLNRLAGIRSKVSPDLQVAMLLASFGDKNKSQFGHAITLLQNGQEGLELETATARLL